MMEAGKKAARHVWLGMHFVLTRDVVQIVWIKDKVQCRQNQVHALR
jgi:hypothetical protein